jgi:hypothetical protein
MALAAKPIFSPSCGAIRIIAGATLDGSVFARDLGIAGALGFARFPASALVFIIGTRCYRGEQAAMVTRKERDAFRYPAGDFQ